MSLSAIFHRGDSPATSLAADEKQDGYWEVLTALIYSMPSAPPIKLNVILPSLLDTCCYILA